MNALEEYEFDRLGYLTIKDMLIPSEVASILEASNKLEKYGIEHSGDMPRKQGVWGVNYHVNEEMGIHVSGNYKEGSTIIVEDFFNADHAFDILVNHPKTMSYISKIIQGAIRINNSELRLRYTGNATGTHMGGPAPYKYRYSYNAKGIDCMMVRMIYFLHDVTKDDGAFCVVPGTHKTNQPSPYESNPDVEPGMIPLDAKAGDAILFTEALRHGGYTNKSSKARKTLHIGYGPDFLPSQNIATMDEQPYILSKTLDRYTPEQVKLFVLHPELERNRK